MAWAGLALQTGTAVMVGLALAGTAWGGAKIPYFDLVRRLPYLLDPVWYSAGFHPNIVGGVLAVLLPTAVAYAWAARTWAHRLLMGLPLLIGTLTLVMTQSRGAMMGFATALIVVAIGRNRRWLWLMVVLLAAVVAGTSWLGVQPALDLAVDSIGTGTLQSGEIRLEILSRGLYMIEDFGLTGVGLGMFPEVLSMLYPLLLLGPQPDVPHVHNVLLQVAVDHGMPGLVAFLAFLAVLGFMANQSRILARGGRLEPLAIGLLAGLVAYLVHGLFDWIWHTPRSHPIIWAYFGLIAALWRTLRVRSPTILNGGTTARTDGASGH
jgi:putative inorganic carbon (HCO3(-)) transporter